MLEGYKTYIGGAGALLLGLYYLIDGKVEEAVTMFTLGMGLVGLRDAINKKQ